MRRSVLASLLLALLLPPAGPAIAGETTGKMIISEDSVDLAKRRIRFRLTTPAKSAHVSAFSPDGEKLHEATHDLPGAEPNAPLSVGWPDLGEHENNFRLELRVEDTKGNTFTYDLIRFYFEIPHEEVVFETGKWEIRPEEEEKLAGPLELLKSAVAQYGKHIQLQVYVAGYTDTVGPAHENQALSEKRARAIAEYFVEHGLGVPLFARGFGESNLAVKTGDNVDEPRNRRARYIISTSPPAMDGPGNWKRVK